MSEVKGSQPPGSWATFLGETYAQPPKIKNPEVMSNPFISASSSR